MVSIITEHGQHNARNKEYLNLFGYLDNWVNPLLTSTDSVAFI
uniref:Uncharacterized protein n=1 Tax=Arundo donax TaxID=35708 RepID=A0A0A9A819_ARUDO